MKPETLVPPPEMQVPRMRFWGDRKPPKSRAQMFSMRVATSAALVSASTDGATDQVGNVATLRIYGPIDSWGGWFGISAKDVASAIDDLPDDISELRVRINSPGGEVWEGLAILNMLRAHKARAIAVVDGLAASAASLIATGCDETVMSPGTQMMIHDPSGFAYGPQAVMLKAARFLGSCGDATASIYTESAGGTDAAWRALMIEETWYTAQEAVDAGLADSVGVVSDAGGTATAGEEPDEPVIIVVDPDDGDVEELFDLKIFSHAGRSHAPAPQTAHSTTPKASAEGNNTQEGSPAVAFSDDELTNMRQKLGVAEDADEATIMAALDEALEERATEPPASPTPSIPEGHVVIPKVKLDELEAGVATANATAEQLRTQERTQFLDSVRDRFLPGNRAAWETEYDRDPKATREHFAKAPVLIPINEIGTSTDPSESAELDAQTAEQLDAYGASLGLPKGALSA